jgi:hypothetical protein
MLDGEKAHELFAGQKEKAISQSEELFRSLLTERKQHADSPIPGFSTHLLVKVG